jgi:predicted AAA+ superfamily ATPase
VKFDILQQYYATVVRRDIIERYDIKNEEAIKALLRLLLNSTQYSISRLYNTMKSMGYEIGKSTLQKYIGYIESSYFMQSVYILSPKVKNQMQYPRKLYFIDNGFISALSTKFSDNMGRLYENMVAVELMRRYSGVEQEIHYWKDSNGKEVDFVIKDGIEIRELIQVSYDISERDTRKREMSALYKASKELGCDNLTIINENEDGEEEYRGNRIRLIPLWKWLIGTY